MPDSAPVDRITPDELAYHAKLIERMKFAESVRPQIAAIDAAWRSWAEHLHSRYELGPGENVDEHGQINRLASDGNANLTGPALAADANAAAMRVH